MAPPKRTVLITGCSDGGIGSALALALHAHNLHIIATARNPQKMQRLANIDGIETRQLDVLSAESIAACVQSVPAVDILINNAGGPYSMPVVDIDIPTAKQLFDLNVWSYIAVTQAFMPLLLKSPAALVVNHSSSASMVAMPFQGTYNASKAAMAMLSDTLRLELEPFGVKVVDLKTGLVRSNIIVNNQEMKRTLPPDSIYAPAGDAVNKSLRQEGMDQVGLSPDEFATAVAKELVKATPPPVIWKGESAWLVWLASFLPVGTLDGTVKKMTGLDVVAKLVRSSKS